jgi:hypothetical protein
VEGVVCLDTLLKWIEIIKNNYILAICGAVVFFGFKSFIGYLTYRKFSKDIEEIKQLIKNLTVK